MPVPDFSPGEVLTAAAMDSIGLWLISTTTVTSAASEILCANVFSSSYANYRIVVENIDLTIAGGIRLQFRDATGNLAQGHDNAGYFVTMAAAPASGVYGNTNQASFQIGFSDTGNTVALSADIYRPNINGQTVVTSYGADSGSLNIVSARQTETKIITGFRLFGASGNISGTVRVYGYRN